MSTSDTMPDIDEGFTPADFVNPKIAAVNYKVIQARLAQANAARPRGYLVREAPAEDIKQLRILSGILNDGQFLTKFRKTFTRAEMSDDLLIRRAGRRDSPDWSEYEEVLPTSPP